MSSTAEFYLEQAARCASAAAATQLPNQRDTFLRAEATWQEMADRSLRTLEARRKREAETRDTKLPGSPGATPENPHEQCDEPTLPDQEG